MLWRCLKTQHVYPDETKMDQHTLMPARDRAAFGSAGVIQPSSHPSCAHPGCSSLLLLGTGSEDKAAPTSREVPTYYRFPFPRSARTLHFCSLFLYPIMVQTYLSLKPKLSGRGLTSMKTFHMQYHTNCMCGFDHH